MGDCMFFRTSFISIQYTLFHNYPEFIVFITAPGDRKSGKHWTEVREAQTDITFVSNEILIMSSGPGAQIITTKTKLSFYLFNPNINNSDLKKMTPLRL